MESRKIKTENIEFENNKKLFEKNIFHVIIISFHIFFILNKMLNCKSFMISHTN